ncbi:siderophore-interacting protein [Nocardioidaceae bacterium]|nr:siderophore-interacting protein [Nocardioidaceae bacterium]
MLVAEVEVAEVTRLSPAFVRVALASPALADVGRPGYDARCKMIFPGPGGRLAPLPQDPEQWYVDWLAQPEAERSPIRTYTVRDVVGEGAATRVVIDMVVHEPDAQRPAGPACAWALAARPGDRVQLVLPHRATEAYAGVEFDPGNRRELLLVGDETAVPAIARVLADLPDGYRGRAYLEVPDAADVLDLPDTRGVEVVWLPRHGAAPGSRAVRRVRADLGLPAGAHEADADSSEVPDLLWETPTYSASGDGVAASDTAAEERYADLYAWIAGESRTVTTLRRALVTELQVPRTQVAFMGYWREGVSMKG